MARRRIVLDTNVCISAALLPRSRPALVLRDAFLRHIVLISIPLLEELARVLSREKFRKYLDPEDVRVFLDGVAANATLAIPRSRIVVCRDPKDDMLLELAVEGRAEILVSGDGDLLSLTPFRGVRILTVDEYLREA